MIMFLHSAENLMICSQPVKVTEFRGIDFLCVAD